MKKIILLSTMFFFCLQFNFAQQAGHLDPSFGHNGIVTADAGFRVNAPVTGNQVFTLPDGSVLILIETNNQSVIAKRHPNGTPDLSYGTYGFSVSVPIFRSHAAMQPDGKIVIAGSTYTYFDYFDLQGTSIARLNTDGSSDNTFNGNGLLAFGSSAISSVAVRSDGEIIIVGSASDFEVAEGSTFLEAYSTTGHFDNGTQISDQASSPLLYVQNDHKMLVITGSEIARYNTDETLDLTFSGDGIEDAAFSIASVAIQSDGKIVVAGGNSIARYNINGSLDHTFSGDGMQTAGFNINSITVQSSGKIVAAGDGVARFNTNGSPDASFSGDGEQTTTFTITSVAVAASGKIVTAGSSGNTFACARYNTNGSPDNSFDGDGRLTDNLHQGSTNYNASAVQTDGKLVVTGSTWNGSDFDFVVVRYNLDGSLDHTLSGTGIVKTDFSGTNNYANSIAIQGDGKIIVAGGNYMSRYNSNGTLDPSFSGDGKQTAGFSIKSIKLQSSGKIIAAGNGAIVRYNTNGSPDLSFHVDPMYTNNFILAEIAIQTDGKIIMAGNNNTPGMGGLEVARFNSNGSIDPAFGAGGVVIDEGDDFDYNPGALSLALQSDGKIVVAGYIGRYRSLSDPLLERYNSNGTLDDGFGDQGVVRGGGADFFNSLAIQSDGKILAAGISGGGSLANFSIARYTHDGTLDNGFNGNGRNITSLSQGADSLQSIIISGNSLYVAGYSQFPGDRGIVARYFLTGGNQAPVVTITTPANNSVYSAPANIFIHANASDADGTISTVQFYSFDERTSSRTLLHTEYVAPYGFLWTDVHYGNYTITAVATDNDGLTTTTHGINISVVSSLAPIASNKSSINNNINNLLSLKLGPNPAQNTLNISINGRLDKPAELYVISSSGVVLKNIHSITSTQLPLNVSSLAKGVYFIKIICGDKTMLKQFVKM